MSTLVLKRRGSIIELGGLMCVGWAKGSDAHQPFTTHLYIVRRPLGTNLSNWCVEYASHIRNKRRTLLICIACEDGATHILRTCWRDFCDCVAQLPTCDANPNCASFPCLCDANQGAQIVLFLLVLCVILTFKKM